MKQPRTYHSHNAMDSSWSQAIKQGLETTFIGHEILCYKRTTSTNDIAKELAGTGIKEGVVIIAREQTRGRGRLHGGHPRTWYSPPGGVYTSIILKPKIPPNQASVLALVGAISVANILRKQYHLDTGIKWPNDVLIGDKKICGVLTEGSTRNEHLDYVIVGLGINVNVTTDALPPEVQTVGTSIRAELGVEVSVTNVIQHLLEEFERLYVKFKEHDLSLLLRTYKSILLTLGQWIRVQTAHETLEGVAQGIDPNGSLVLQLDDNSVRRIVSGEVVESKRI